MDKSILKRYAEVSINPDYWKTLVIAPDDEPIMDLRGMIERLIAGEELTADEITAAIRSIRDDEASDTLAGGFLAALHMRMKGKMPDLTGCERIMREIGL